VTAPPLSTNRARHHLHRLAGPVLSERQQSVAAPSGVGRASSSAGSAALNWMSAAPALSARHFGVLVPGMGPTCWPWASAYASATCPRVAPARPAISRTVPAMARLARSASCWKRAARAGNHLGQVVERGEPPGQVPAARTAGRRCPAPGRRAHGSTPPLRLDARRSCGPRPGARPGYRAAPHVTATSARTGPGLGQ